MRMEGILLGVVASALSADPRQAAPRSRELGFAGLQFDAAAAGGLDLTELSASGRRELRRVWSAQDQQLIGLRVDAGARGFAPGADVDRTLARLDQVMEAAAGLAAPLVCIDLGPLPAAPASPTPRPRPTQAQAGLLLLPETAAREPAPPPEPPAPPPDPAFDAQLHAALDDLGRRADRYSVMLAFRSELASLASLHQAVCTANCPWFGIDLDPVAILRDPWDVDEVFSRLGSHVRHVRGRDALLGAGHRTKPAAVGQGGVPWDRLLANLDEAAFRGWITLDPLELNDRTGAAQAGLAFLRRMRT